GPTTARDLAVAPCSPGGIAVVGTCTDTVPLPGGKFLPCAGGFVVKYDAAGQPLWGRVAGPGMVDDIEGVAIDGAGSVLFTDGFSKSLTLGAKTVSAPGADVFAGKAGP